MLFTCGVKVKTYSHIVGTAAVYLTNSTEYLGMYVLHFLCTFSKELFRGADDDNHAFNEIKSTSERSRQKLYYCCKG